MDKAKKDPTDVVSSQDDYEQFRDNDPLYRELTNNLIEAMCSPADTLKDEEKKVWELMDVLGKRLHKLQNVVVSSKQLLTEIEAEQEWDSKRIHHADDYRMPDFLSQEDLKEALMKLDIND